MCVNVQNGHSQTALKKTRDENNSERTKRSIGRDKLPLIEEV